MTLWGGAGGGVTWLCPKTYDVEAHRRNPRSKALVHLAGKSGDSAGVHSQDEVFASTFDFADELFCIEGCQVQRLSVEAPTLEMSITSAIHEEQSIISNLDLGYAQFEMLLSLACFAHQFYQDLIETAADLNWLIIVKPVAEIVKLNAATMVLVRNS
jgi:hypothetical protein